MKRSITFTREDFKKAMSGFEVPDNLAVSFMEGAPIRLEDSVSDLFSFVDYENWLGMRAQGEISQGRFISFCYLVFLAFRNRAYKPEDYSLAFQVQYRITKLTKYYYDLYDDLKKTFNLTDEEADRKLVGAALEDIRRYRDNESLPLEMRNLTIEEKEDLVKKISEKKELAPEEKAAFEPMLLSLCAKGSAWAHIFYGGYLYGEGIDEQTGILKSYAKCLEHYLQAGDLGDYEGYMLAGYIYYYNRLNNPEGPDYPAAFRCFSYGADHGDLEAFYKLSDMYANGYFVRKDYQEAQFILRSHYYDAFSAAYWKGDYYFIGPYTLRLGKDQLYGANGDRNLALGLFNVALYAYQWRYERNSFFGDLSVINNLKTLIAETESQLKVTEMPFTLPYELSDEEEEITSGNLLPFTEMIEKIHVSGKKGDNHLILDFSQNQQGAFPFPLLRCGKVLLFTNLRISMELDKPLSQDFHQELTEKNIGMFAFYEDIGLTIAGTTYQTLRSNIIGFSLGSDPIRVIGSQVKLTKAKANIPAGSKGIIKEIEPDGEEFLVEFFSADGDSLNLLKVQSGEVSFLHPHSARKKA